jgi:cell shape-determining protein MreC
MGVLDGIERLINEHGSSVILKERIALINDKYAALEQKLFASELRTKNLESDNKTLKATLNKSTRLLFERYRRY